MPASVASLDTTSRSEASYDSDDDRLAEQEWEESLRELQDLVGLVLLPFVGKWLGRRWSHWAYARYVRLGLGKTFFLGGRTLTPKSTRN